MDAEAIRRASDAIRRADALLLTAGAGMGVDSGLPDFRGDEGFWRAYPPIAKLGLSFAQMANPRWFLTDPTLAWGFYGHRLALYRKTTPHAGFGLLRRWAEGKPGGAFVFTSNVDGAFQRAGFAEDRVLECHGAIDWSQCTRACGVGIFPAADAPVVDEATLRAAEPLPRCPACGALARPNVLMFGDGGWDACRTEAQEARFEAWLDDHAGPRLVVIECGAGTAIPTVRSLGERLVRRSRATLVRVNVREPQLPSELAGGSVSMASGALAALTAIDAAL